MDSSQQLALHIYETYVTKGVNGPNPTEAIAALINAFVLKSLDKVKVQEKISQNLVRTGRDKAIQPLEINGIMVETKTVKTAPRRI